jgi:hypothetical protein
VVVAATQGAACFGAAYQFVFNVAYHLRKHKLRVPVAIVSAEPFPGHFGIGGLPGGEKLLGMFFKRQKIDGIFDVAMQEVAPGEVRLADGRALPFKYAMVVPPFAGAEVVKASGLGNPKGFIGSRTPTRRSPTPTSTPSGSRPPSAHRGRAQTRSGCPRPDSRPRRWRAWQPPTSRRRSAASSPAERRR